MQLQNYNREQKSFLYCFQHRCSLYVPNFSKIISLEIKNFRARLSKNPGQGKGFLWGGYDLYLFYCRFVQGIEVTAEKVFPRNFSSPLAMLPVFMEKNFDAEKINIIFTESYNTAVEPLLPALFPLMGRFNYLPFKIGVEVTGQVYSILNTAPVEQESRPRQGVPRAETAVENTMETEERTGAVTESAAVEAEKREVPDVTFEKTAAGKLPEAAGFKTTGKLPPAAAENFKAAGEGPAAAANGAKAAEVSQTAVNLPPDPRYYTKYRLFYEHFFQEKPIDIFSKRK